MPASASTASSSARPKNQFFGTLITMVVSCVILGAIWIASMSIVENFRIARATDQILDLVKMSQDFASRNSSFAEQANEDLLTDLATAGQMPALLNADGQRVPLLNPWYLEVRASTVSPTQMQIATGVPARDCLRLGQFFATNAKTLGLKTAEAQVGWRGLSHRFFDDSQNNAPTLSAISAACSVGAAPVLSLTFAFR